MYVIEIAFGHCRADGTSLAHNEIENAEKHILQTLTQLFGGGQIQHATGGYLSEDGQLVIETSSVIRAYTNGNSSYLSQLGNLAQSIAQTLEQETVMLTVIRLGGSINLVHSDTRIAPEAA